MTLIIAHYYIYHKENEFVLKKINLNDKPKKDLSNIEKNMKDRQIIYIQGFNSSTIDMDWIEQNMDKSPELTINALSEKNKSYNMPLKDWYSIFKKKKHKPLLIYPDRKTLSHFNYDVEYNNAISGLINNRFYYMSELYLKYYSSRTLNLYEQVKHFYRIIIPKDNNMNILLVSPSKSNTLYLKENKDVYNYEYVLSKYQSNKPIKYKKYPKAKNMRYITVSIKKNDLLMIPYNWSYSIQDYKGIIVEGNMENIASYIWKYL